MWLIKVFGVMYFTAVCAAQESVTNVVGDNLSTPATSAATSAAPTEPPVPSLQLLSTWDEVFPSEKVELTCSVTGSSDWTFIWFRDENEVQASDPNVSLSSGGSVLTITAASHVYSGSYTCKGRHKTNSVTTAASNSRRLVVHEHKPTPTMTRSSNFNKMFPGESVTFTCMVDVSSGWEYLWYHDGQEVQASSSNTYTMVSIALHNTGEYVCKAKRGKGPFYTGESKTALLVSDPPEPTLKLRSRWTDVFENETVEFQCEVDSDDWTVTWYKNQEQLQEDDSIVLDEDKPLLNVTWITQEYQGGYACKAHLESRKVSSGFSNRINVIVYDHLPKPTIRKDPGFNLMYVGETVIFTCSVNVSSGWEYEWYKDGGYLPGTNQTIIHLGLSDEGKYSCMATRSETTTTTSSENIHQHVREIPVPSLNITTLWPDVFPTENVTLRCGMDGSSDWIYTWYRDGQKVQADQSVSFDWDAATLSISSASALHRGQYSCSGTLKSRPVNSGISSGVTLNVYDDVPTPLMTQQPDDDKMYTGESVSFQCNVKLSSGWEYFWYKDKQRLPVNSNVLNIGDANISTSGKYQCMAKRRESMYKTEFSQERDLHVYEIPVPSLNITTPWPDVFPTETVTLRCGMDGSSDWIYTWYRDGQKVQADQSVSFDLDAATLSISSASALHRGQYSCSGTLKRRSVNSGISSGRTLNVYDKVPRVTLMQYPDYNVMHTGDSVSFSCHIDVSSGWEYLWYKDNSPLEESGNNYTIISVLTKNTGSYTCQTKRGRNTNFYSDQSQAVRLDIKERPQADIILLTGWSEVFSTDRLVLKCGVENDKADMWNYTWFKEGQPINQLPLETHVVTPQDDPEQSQYQCQGIRTGRPSYSKHSDRFTTKNLLLKRRVLLSISGCILFCIVVVILGCIFLRVFRKPARDEYKPEEADLFLSMAHLKDRDDAPCPLVQYITDAALNSSSKEGDENGTICSETTPLPITSQEDQAETTESQNATENGGGLASFKQ